MKITGITNPNQKGNVAELAVALEAAKLGIPVLAPLTEHGRYDLGLEMWGRLLRVQCKWANLRRGAVVVRMRTNRRGPEGFITSTYDRHEIDAIAAYCEENSTVYLVPIELIEGRSMLHLRTEPARNGQYAAVNFAAEYEFGAVAQLEERSDGIRKAGGSSPPSSIFPSPLAGAVPGLTEVGAHEFRNHFGRYMEEAAAGAEILVRRRGRPYVRLTAVEPQLSSAAA